MLISPHYTIQRSVVWKSQQQESDQAVWARVILEAIQVLKTRNEIDLVEH